MPVYSFKCRSCDGITDEDLPVEDRTMPRECACGGPLKRLFSPPHVAPIPGIYNRVNRHWKEGGEVIPHDGRKEERTARLKQFARNK